MATCKIDGREIQATIKNEPVFDVDVSKHTNEGGSSYTDHMRPQQEVLALDIVCSDVWKGHGVESFGTAGVSTAGNPFDARNDAQSMFNFLYDLYRNPRPVPVETPRRDYPALALASFKPHQSDSKFAKALSASLSFVEWKTGQLRTQQITVAQGKQVKKGTVPNKKPVQPQQSGAAAAAQAAGAISADPTDQVVRGADGVLRKPVGQNPDGSLRF